MTTFPQVWAWRWTSKCLAACTLSTSWLFVFFFFAVRSAKVIFSSSAHHYSSSKESMCRYILTKNHMRNQVRTIGSGFWAISFVAGSYFVANVFVVESLMLTPQFITSHIPSLVCLCMSYRDKHKCKHGHLHLKSFFSSMQLFSVASIRVLLVLSFDVRENLSGRL